MPTVSDKPPRPDDKDQLASPVQRRPSSATNPNPTKRAVTPRPQDSESRSTTARPTQDVRSSDSRESRNSQNNSNPNIPRPESRSTTTAARSTDVKSNERELPRKPPHDNPNPIINSAPHPESQSTTTTVHFTGHDSQDVKERETKKLQNNSDLASTTTGQRTSSRSATHHHPQAGDRRSGSGHSSHEDSDSVENDYAAARSGPGHSTAPREREQSSIQTPTTTTHRTTRVLLKPGSQHDPSLAQPTRSSKDPHDQHPPGVAEGATTHPYDRSTGRPMNAQVPPGHHEQRDRVLDIKQSSQGPSYTQGIMNTIISSIIPPSPSLPPKDRYEVLKDKYRQTKDERDKLYAHIGEYDRELKRTNGELRHKNRYVDQLLHEKQQMKDSINGLQNELNNVHHQLEDAKNLSEVRGKELFGAQVFLTKADTLSISEVGEKVTALNEEIFQAAATLGEGLIHKRHEVSQTEFDAAAAESVQMVGELMTHLLISQSQKPEPDVNPFIVQVVLQIFMVKFCVSKIQSWYPGDSTIGEFLTAIYSEIRSTEEQAVSGRWRALTRAHTRPSTDTWQEELFKKLLSVSKVAAWMTRSFENEESFRHRLPPIFKAVNELRMAMGEKITSADLDISVFDCHFIYDPSIMDDAYGDGRQSSGKRASESIVGTTGIGLNNVVVERNSDALRFQKVIPAKVVLKSTVTEALEPVKPSMFRKLKKKVIGSSLDGSADTEGSRGSSKVDNMDVTQG